MRPPHTPHESGGSAIYIVEETQHAYIYIYIYIYITTNQSISVFGHLISSDVTLLNLNVWTRAAFSIDIGEQACWEVVSSKCLASDS